MDNVTLDILNVYCHDLLKIIFLFDESPALRVPALTAINIFKPTEMGIHQNGSLIAFAAKSYTNNSIKDKVK